MLSTLHTNDAPNAVTRLVDMGMEAYKIASALRGVVAQRLMRRLCPACMRAGERPVPERHRALLPPGAKLFRAVGCPECAMTGYRGRFSIVEVLTMNAELERLIGAGRHRRPDRRRARGHGMRSLFDSGLRHVVAGESTVEELLRVTDVPPEEPKERRTARREPAGPAGRGHRAAAARRPAAGAPAPRPAPRSTSRWTSSWWTRSRPPTARRRRARRGAPGAPGGGRGPAPPGHEGPAASARATPWPEARDGVQALDQVDRHAPDIIMLDLNLPGLDGYGVLSQLRSRHATRNIPVMVLTAKGDEDNEVRVFELGADDFLTKPFRARALPARLEAVLGRHRA